VNKCEKCNRDTRETQRGLVCVGCGNLTRNCICMDCILNNGWTREWPIKEGLYWFYGFRWGRTEDDKEAKRRLMLVHVHELRKGCSYVTEGAFMYKAETEDAWFIKAELPSLPEVSD